MKGESSLVPSCHVCLRPYSTTPGDASEPIRSQVCGHTWCRGCIEVMQYQSQFDRSLLICKRCGVTQQTFPTEDFPGSPNELMIELVEKLNRITRNLTHPPKFSVFATSTKKDHNPWFGSHSKGSNQPQWPTISSSKRSNKMDEEVNPNKQPTNDKGVSFSGSWFK